MWSRLEALVLRDLISSWVRMWTGVRTPGFTMRFPIRRESAVPPFLSWDVPRDWTGGRPFGWRRVFPCVLCALSWLSVGGCRWGGSLIWGVGYVGRQYLPFGSAMVAAILWRMYGPVEASGGGLMSSLRQPSSQSGGGVPVMSQVKSVLCKRSVWSCER